MHQLSTGGARVRTIVVGLLISLVSIPAAFADDFVLDPPEQTRQVWIDIENTPVEVNDAYVQFGDGEDAEYVELCQNFYGLTARISRDLDSGQSVKVFGSVGTTGKLVVSYTDADGVVLSATTTQMTVERFNQVPELLSCAGAQLPPDQVPNAPIEPSDPGEEPSSVSDNDAATLEDPTASASEVAGPKLPSTGTAVAIVAVIAVALGLLGIGVLTARRVVNK